jgi:hypothetical protein
VSCRIDDQIADGQRTALFGRSCLGTLRAPQHGLDPRQEHVQIKGLGHIVVGPQLQPQHFVQLTASRGHKDHGHTHLRPKVPQGIQAIHSRESDVQQHQVRPVARRNSQRVFGSSGAADAVASLFQVEGQAAPQQRVVIYQQNVDRQSFPSPRQNTPHPTWG